VKLRENKAIHNSPSADGRDQSSPQGLADDAGFSLRTVKKLEFPAAPGLLRWCSKSRSKRWRPSFPMGVRDL